MLQRVEVLKVKQFRFEQAEEVLYHGIVQTVAFSTHALPDILAFQHPLVLLASVGMKNQSRTIRDCVKGFLQHGSDHTEYRMLRDCIAYKIFTAQIEKWRQVQLLAEQGELCHVCDPFLVRLLSIG